MRDPANRRLHLLQVFALTGAGHGGAQMLLNAAFGDYGMALTSAVSIGTSVGYYALLPKLPARVREPLTHGFNFACFCLVTTVCPAGALVGVYFVAFCMSTVLISSRSRYTFPLVLAAVAVYLTVPEAKDYAKPVWAGFAAATFVSFAQFYALLRGDLRSLRATALALSETEVELAREAEAVAVRRERTAFVRLSLSAARERLDHELADELAATGRLRLRRAEERALVEAMHHDMREPLRSIVSFNQLIARRLRHRGLSERGLQFLDFVADAGHRLARMLDDLLAYSTRASAAEREPVDLVAILAGVRANLADQLTRTGATLLVASDLPVVIGYPTPLLQLFQNLIANALKFSRPGISPVVRVEVAREAGGGVAVTVRDNGIGIAPEHLASVFALFERGSADEASEGSGVGLALCQRIARRHGGSLAAQSILGEGSAFTFALPDTALYTGATSDVHAIGSEASGVHPARASRANSRPLTSAS